MFALSPIVRLGVFLVAAAASLAASIILCNTPSEAAHLAIAPGFVIYLLLFRQGVFRTVGVRHVLYLAVATALVAGYMWSLAYLSPGLAVRWRELPVAVYFLVSVHILTWVLFRLVGKVTRAIFFIHGEGPIGNLRRGAAGITWGVLFLAIIVPYLSATFMIHWVKFTDISDRYLPRGMALAKVAFEATDGVRLGAWFIRRPGHTSDTTVILTPPRNLAKIAALPYAQMLTGNGYNVLLVDLRGQGPSEGHTFSFGVFEANDVLGALRYLRLAHPKASRHVFGFGLSQGAGAVIAAAATDHRIKGIVVDSASPVIKLPLERQIRALPSPVGRYLRYSILMVASGQLGCNLFAAEPIRNIGRVRGPVLIVHGQEDKVVPLSHAKRLFAAAGAPAILWKVPRAAHGETLAHGLADYPAHIQRIFEPVRHGGQPLETPWK